MSVDVFGPHVEVVARHFWGDPNPHASSAGELRFGAHGSKSVDLEKGTWFDHEAAQGGGVLDLVAREANLKNGEAATFLKDELGVAIANTPGWTAAFQPKAQPKRIVATYDYVDAHGEVIFEVVRYEPKTFRQRRPPRAGDDPRDVHGGYVWSVKGIEQVPYRLPELINATETGGTVYICEGEKDVDNVWKLGFPASCNAMGAGKWQPELSHHFRGLDVVILPDNDDAGQKHLAIVGDALTGIAKSVRYIEMPGRSLKQDVSDWIGAGGDAAGLRALTETAQAWKGPASLETLSKPKLFTASWPEECEPEAEEWLIHGLVPVRSYVLLYGRRGAAKSFFALDLCNRASLGAKVLGQLSEQFGTIYFVGEKKSRFGKRVKAWRLASGKDRPNVMFAWGAPNLLDEESVNATIRYINEQRPAFEARGVKLGMAVFDTLVRAIGGANDSDFEVAGKGTGAIQRIIDECGITVMPLHHMAKSKDADTARGAGVWEDAADSIIRIERKEDDPVRRIQLTKQSDEADGLEFGFKLEVVEVGTSPRGNAITSCIVRQTEVPDEVGLNKAPRLSAAAQKVLQAIYRLLDDGVAHPPPPVPGVHRGVKTVALNDLREKAFAIGLSAAAYPPPDADDKALERFANTRRKAFRDGLEALERAKQVRQEQGFVWVIAR